MEGKKGPFAYLGPACRELRRERGVRLLDIAYRLRRSEGTLSRFERGQSQPHDMDHVLWVYAEALRSRPAVIWARALELMEGP
jgi:transcriptional regulator with XRE-family HTH domain